MRDRNKFFILLFTLLMCFLMTENVNAVSKKIVRSSGTFGADGWSGTPKSMSYKGIDKAKNKNAWCTTFAHPNDVGFKNDTYSSEKCGKSNWFGNATDKDFVIAGQIVEAIKNGESNSNNRYDYTVMALNTYFYDLKIEGSTDFTSSSSGKCKARGGKVKCGTISSSLKSKIKKYISTAKTNATDIITSLSWNKVPAVSQLSSTTMSRITPKSGSAYYLSKSFKVTQDSSLANGTAITTTITASGPSGATVQICNSSGGSCAASKTGNGTYTVKAIGNLNGGEVKVNVKSTTSFSYKKGVVLCRTKDKTNQAMMILDSPAYAPAPSTPLTLKIPNNNNELEILKVDGNGEEVKGATLKLYDKNGAELNLNSSGDPSFKYVSTESLLNHTFKIVETSAPNGYKLSTSREITMPSTSGTSCYKVNDDETMTAVTGNDANNYCNSKQMCQLDSEAPVAIPDEDPTCQSLIPTSTPEPTGTTGTTDTTDTTETTDTTGTTGTTEPAVTHTAKLVCTINNGTSDTIVDDKYCVEPEKYSSITVNGNSVLFTFPNVLNEVHVSKKDMTGKEEVPGAKLKICTVDSYNKVIKDGKSAEDCEVYKNVKDVELQWVSTNEERVVSGLKPGEYYIIETLPPSGYKVSTATKFSIDAEGKIKIDGTEVANDLVVINNALTNVTISKIDIVTTKELPGAHLSICEAGLKDDIGNPNSKDETYGNDDDDEDSTGETTETTAGTTESTSTTTATASDDSDEEDSTNPNDYGVVLNADGNCLPVSLADGSSASWTSTDKPHTISGLPAGTYYLVEITAPNGYATAESILFKMNKYGELTDIAGNSLKDNKIVMKDAPIKQVKTGNKALIITIIGALMAAVASVYFFGFHKVAHAGGIDGGILKRVKTRKIHKK